MPLPDAGRLYGRWYYENYAGNPYEDDHWAGFFAHIADCIIRQLNPQRVLDAGCAKGFLVAALRERGVEAFGFDVSELAVAEAPDGARPHVRVGSLTDPIEDRFDLITCIEVIEHLDPADAATAVANLCAASDRVLLSSTPADLHEPTHVNVQPPERWAQHFAGHGFFRDFRHDAGYLTPWAALYRRSELSVTDVVLDYERAWYQLRSETTEQRKALLDLQSQCEELQTHKDAREALEAERDGLHAQIGALEGSIGALEESIRTKDHELDALRGHAAELDASLTTALARSEALEQRIHEIVRSRSWRAVWALGWPLRVLRRRSSAVG